MARLGFIPPNDFDPISDPPALAESYPTAAREQAKIRFTAEGTH
jgi:hypothetical protein